MPYSPPTTTSAPKVRWSEIIRPLLRSYRTALHRRNVPSAAVVHEARVATRRLEAVARALSPWLTAAEQEEVMRRLHRPFRHLGAARDVHVLRHWVKSRPPSALRQALLTTLQRQRHKARRRAKQALRRGHPRRVTRPLLRAALRADAANAPVAARLRQAVQHQREIVVAARKMSVERAPRALHQWRLALKAERYLLELAAAAGLPGAPRSLLACTQGQEALGHLTDLQLARRFVKRYARHHPRQAASAAPLERRLAASCRQATAAVQV